VMNKIALTFLMLLSLSIPLLAHHGNASYDTTKSLVVNGTVTEYIWANPHVFLKVDSKDENGSTSHWLVEAQSTVTQNAAGWTKNTFKPGDQVSIDVIPIKSGAPIGRFRGRIVINGTVFKEGGQPAVAH